MALRQPGTRNRRKLRAVVIGASAGGINALRKLLRGLAADFRPPVIIVLHSASSDHSSLAASFSQICALPVSEAAERSRVEPRHVYLAPPGYHLLVERHEQKDRFALSVDDRVCFVRPAVDVLFESAADLWRAGVVGVVLTGANDDGARGAAAIRASKGRVIVQSPEEAESPEMPAAALRIAGADHVLKLAQIAPLLNSYSDGTAK